MKMGYPGRGAIHGGHKVESMAFHQLGVIAQIHAKCFDDPWGEATLDQILMMNGAFGLIVRRPRFEAVGGFALARIVADECELLSLGVSPDCRKQGMAKALLRESMVRAAAFQARWFFLEVAQDNLTAARLYEAHGLRKVGERPDYYETKDGRRTDAHTMRRSLQDLLF